MDALEVLKRSVSQSVPTGALYYPWMHDRSDAHVIELSEDEKRNNIDFMIPRK